MLLPRRSTRRSEGLLGNHGMTPGDSEERVGNPLIADTPRGSGIVSSPAAPYATPSLGMGKDRLSSSDVGMGLGQRRSAYSVLSPHSEVAATPTAAGITVPCWPSGPNDAAYEVSSASLLSSNHIGSQWMPLARK